MKLELIAKVLVEAGIGAIGTDIFVHRMDAETEAGVMLRNPLEGTPVDPDLPGYYRARLQAIVRNNKQSAGEQVADRVMKALTITNRRFTDPNGKLLLKINRIYPSQLPIVYPRLPGQGLEWSLNFQTSFVQP